MPVILDYRNTIQNFIHESGRSVWAKDLVAAAVTNKGCLTDKQLFLNCEDISVESIISEFEFFIV